MIRRHQAITAREHLEFVQQHRDGAYWQQWAMRALLILGAAHFLAGVVFFFAYNWDELSSFTKFGILQFAIVAAFTTALVLKLDSLSGQALLIVASVLTGVLLAVIGQTYQTGADAWELFAAWSVLILPWVLASKSLAHWFMWIVICLTVLTLYGGQVLVALAQVSEIELATIIGVLPMVFLAVRELQLQRGVRWLKGHWFRRSLVVLSLSTLFVLAVSFVLFDADSSASGLLAYLLVSAGLALVYRQWLPDFSILAMVLGLASLLAMAIGGRVIFDLLFSAANSGSLVLGLLLLGGWCAAVTTGVVRLLDYLNKQFNSGVPDE